MLKDLFTTEIFNLFLNLAKHTSIDHGHKSTFCGLTKTAVVVGVFIAVVVSLHILLHICTIYVIFMVPLSYFVLP